MLGREKMSVAQMRAALDPPVKPARFHSIIRQMVRDGEIEVIEIVKAGPRIKNAPLYGLKRTSASDLDPETTPSTP